MGVGFFARDVVGVYGCDRVVGGGGGERNSKIYFRVLMAIGFSGLGRVPTPSPVHVCV